MTTIDPAMVAKWFRQAAPRWKPPAEGDVRDLADLMTQLVPELGADPEEKERGARPLPELYEALRLYLPHLTPLVRAHERQAAAEGITPKLTVADLMRLQAVRDWLKETTIPKRPRSGSEWHGTAFLIADGAIRAWKDAGNKKVGSGNKAESPVVKFVLLALALFGMSIGADAIVKALQSERRAHINQSGLYRASS